ncbi:hypothetical protein EPUS_07282 [Endocarpon pusillum Z07020]|uniref:LEM-like domain-containing protein n=1 Tax=Endocarpon pusillum (strain Z07020 / HMAS-L-300199) TaxID=1263415 RepID=U1FX68_ENDPU|nr:uncharacterized protein EPUS_07282 [Endocarpon pusillum Z07020]ERF69467.1 hypothetical protein EPUS_07282 [Endocarpon pusillum Z07020]
MATSDDELAYLQPGFALSSLTVPKLRSILVSHDITYPSSAKKPQLIQLVEDHVLPHSRKILNARAHTKRTSKGITDMPSSQESSTVDGEDEDEMPPPPVPAKTPAAAAAKEEESSPPPTTARRAPTPGGRKNTVKHPRVSDTDTDTEKIRPSARKTRKSEAPTIVLAPHVHIDEPDLPVKSERRANGESPFTYDNPFQSGSSPSADNRRISASSSRSRKSLGNVKEDRRKSSSARRKTTSPNERPAEQEDGITAPSRSTFEFPVSRIKAERQEEIEPTEEFTPEEQLELVRDRAAQGYSGSQLIPARQSTLTRRARQPASTATKSATWGVLLTLLGSIGAWYRKEKIDIGYCGVGQPDWSLSNYNTNIPTWVKDTLQPACEPCPQHAFCYPSMEIKCEHDFVLKPHPLSLGGLIPLPPTCEPDGEKVRRVKMVADRAVEELRERRAAFECGEDIKNLQSTEDSGEGQTIVRASKPKLEISEEALREEVGKMRRKGMSDAEFNDLWQGALGEITGREEVEVIRDGSGSILLSSSSLARFPLGCAIRLSVLRTLSRNRLPLSVLAVVILSSIYARHKVTTYRSATAQIPTLVNTTLDRLATQAALVADGRVSEGFISVGQLRDDVLRSTFSKEERERIWAGVKRVVEQNSNVRAGNREGERTGEWSRVWEWIGPVDFQVRGLEGGRRSGGLIREAGEEEQQQNHAEGGELVQGSSRKWDEGRPIY